MVELPEKGYTPNVVLDKLLFVLNFTLNITHRVPTPLKSPHGHLTWS